MPWRRIRASWGLSFLAVLYTALTKMGMKILGIGSILYIKEERQVYLESGFTDDQ